MSDTRIETDAMGPMPVPADALYGASTARAVQNFPISGWTMPHAFLAALGLIKAAAAAAHKQARRLEPALADAIIAAAREVADGRLDLEKHFPVDVFQTGSGTSTNMNANEVIANRACQLLGAALGDKARVHPNDHVNMGQSSNDVIPSALHVAAAIGIRKDLIPALRALQDALTAKAREFDSVVKIARTHLMDAVPVRLGQEFSGYAAQIDGAIRGLAPALDRLCELAIGGTAVGTGLNAPAGFAQQVCTGLVQETGLPFRPAANFFEALAARDAALYASGALKSVAIAMGKIASDIRLLGSGPRCGLGELVLPATQPGSSIMPGKVNPVLCESVIQVACQVIGCDAAITAGATGGVGSLLDLNVACPLIAVNLLTAIRLLTTSALAFAAKCISGLTANEARCRDLIEQSLSLVTVLAPRIGYDRAADLAKQAALTGQTIRQLCLAQNVLPEAELNALLDARAQTGP
ncbi:MAG: class II fumarate hydratase [Planctomycetota bacterium]